MTVFNPDAQTLFTVVQGIVFGNPDIKYHRDGADEPANRAT
jgi:hypothetical protein